MSQKTAIIIGAGPAGLTAAYELATRTDIIPIILERSNDIGGISKTVNYKGNRIDIGGHRFFSKSDVVMNWWLNILPLTSNTEDAFAISYQNKSRNIDKDTYKQADPEKTDKVMLVRNRLSRIYYLKRFFSYPVSLSVNTVKQLGITRMTTIFFSYLKSRIAPIKEEKSLEDFLINRFGSSLYKTFFKDYTEKVWGIECSKISAEWGAQRIKGLSISKALAHALKASFKKSNSISQKELETSLIEKFLYPKLGPGQMWEEVARIVEQKTGKSILFNKRVVGFKKEQDKIVAVTIQDAATGAIETLSADYFISSMPVQELVLGIEPAAPANVRAVASGLMYRDFITVGLLLKKLRIRHDQKAPEGINNTVKDNWIYIQEKNVKIGRLQIFNNWSPYMVNSADTVWIGLEYFCNVGDELWNMKDEDFIKFAIDELDEIEIIHKADVLDSTILRVEKAYPAYFGTYDRFDEIKEYVNKIPNLYLVGRNGMHRYNNSDHSMLTAIAAVDNIISSNMDKNNIWEINTEQEYHESKN